MPDSIVIVAVLGLVATMLVGIALHAWIVKEAMGGDKEA